MVSIKCQSQYNAMLLACCSFTVTGDGAGGPEAGPLQPQGPRPPPRRRSRGAHGRLRDRSWEPELPSPALGPGAGWLKQIQGITLLQAPAGGDGREEGLEAVSSELLFLSPLSPQSELQAYMVKEKKIIKKTYKITIEKVILLGEAPLRLRGAFVHFFFFFFKCSFPSAT